MADVTIGEHLIWRAADTTGIVGALHINALIWCETTANAIADTNELAITNQDGRVILTKAATGVGDGLTLFWPRGAGPVFNGIKVPTLGGGELHIWVDQEVK